MSYAPYQVLNAEGVLSALKADANPLGLRRCPVCGSVDGLQVMANGAECHCSTCLFCDDIIGLYASVSGVSLKKAMEDLLRFSEWGGESEETENLVDEYMSLRKIPTALRIIVEEGHKRILNKTCRNIPELVEKCFGVRIEYGCDHSMFGQYVSAVTRSDFAPLMHLNQIQAMSKWMRHDAAVHLAIPIYITRAWPLGLVVYNRRGEQQVFWAMHKHRNQELPQGGMVFPRMIRRHHVNAIVASSHDVAVQLTVRALSVGEPIVPIVGIVDSHPRPLNLFTNQDLICWGRHFEQSYEWAKNQRFGRCTAVPMGMDLLSINPIDVMPKLRQIVHESGDIYSELAKHLASCSGIDAEEMIARLDLRDDEVNAVISACNPLNLDTVRSLLLGETDQTFVTYGKQKIHAAADGWRVRDEIISDAILMLRTAEVSESGSLVVSGVVKFQGKNYEFSDRLEAVRKGGPWVEKFLLEQGVGLPYISRTWRSRLYDIAMLFNRPAAETTSCTTGWSSNDGVMSLRMPNFSVDDNGVHPVDEIIKNPGAGGAGLIIPDHVHAEDIGAVTRDTDFWKLFLFIAAHLVDPVSPTKAPSAVITGASRELWANVTHRALHLRKMTTASPGSLAVNEENSIMPVFVEAITDTSLKKWISHGGRRRAMLCGSGAIGPVLNYDGWVVINVDKPPGGHVDHIMPQVFNFLSFVIPYLPLVHAKEMGLFWVLGDLAKHWIMKYRDNAMGFRRAGISDTPLKEAIEHLYTSQGIGEAAKSEGVRFITLIRDLVRCGELRGYPDPGKRFVRFSWKAIMSFFDNVGVPCPTPSSASKFLKPHLYDIATKEQEVVVKWDDWVLYGTPVG